MRRLAMWTLLLFVITSALTVSAIAYARSRPNDNPLKARGFGVCEGKPCFMGIVPGITSWEQTHTFISQYITVERDNNFFRFDTGYVDGYINRYPEELATTNIVFGHAGGMYAGFPDIREFILFYGLPCGVDVELDPASDQIYQISGLLLHYPSMVVGMSARANSQENTISYITISKIPNDICSSATTPWKGFASAKRYITTRFDK